MQHFGHHNTQHLDTWDNNIQHNDIHHKRLICHTQHKQVFKFLKTQIKKIYMCSFSISLDITTHMWDFQVFLRRKCLKIDTWYCIHNTPFSLELMNQPNKLDCIITLSWKGLQLPNTLIYWASS
jgi:hypothetical protein